MLVSTGASAGGGGANGLGIIFEIVDSSVVVEVETGSTGSGSGAATGSTVGSEGSERLFGTDLEGFKK